MKTVTKKKKKPVAAERRTPRQALGEKSSSLSATSEVLSIPPKVFLYGVPGVGKTAFAANSPNPVFLIDSTEQGIHVLKQTGAVPKDVLVFPACHTWESVIGYLDELVSNPEDRQTLVVDSLTGIQQLAFTHHCDTKFGGDWSKGGFLNFFQGPLGTSQNEWKEFIKRLDLIGDKGLTVILIGHAHSKIENPPGEEGYNQWQPVLDGRILKATDHWASEMLFMDYHREIEVKDGKHIIKQAKDRWIHTVFDGRYHAKSWHGLPPLIPMGDSGNESWSNFNDELQKTLKGES